MAAWILYGIHVLTRALPRNFKRTESSENSAHFTDQAKMMRPFHRQAKVLQQAHLAGLSAAMVR
jgi:hypothetical protein